MVGDGIDDAAAQADIGIATATEAELTAQAVDALLGANRPTAWRTFGLLPKRRSKS